VAGELVVSLIEPGELLEPAKLIQNLASGSLEGLPHVEFTDLEKLRQCPDKARCDEAFTHVLNLESNALEVERALSQHWNRYDARVYWRAQTALNQPGNANCLLGGFDTRLGAWNGSILEILPPGDFCDGNLPIDPVWAPGICGLGTGIAYLDIPKGINAVAQAQLHGLATYYPEYLKDSARAILTHLPTAAYPDGILAPYTRSRAVQGIVRPAPNPGLYLELIQRAQEADARGAAYLLTSNPLIAPTARPILRPLPTDQWDLTYPGLRGIELLKSVSTRTGIHSRWAQFADNRAFGGEPRPTGESGVASAEEHSRYGHATFLEVFPETITEASPRVPTMNLFCFALTAAPPWVVPIPLPPLPVPIIHLASSRLNTRWYSVPEGYALPSVK
jgi:hypothetical protein